MRLADADTKHLKERADRLTELVHERSAALSAGTGRRYKKARKSLQKVERKLEHVSKRIPVDTALDRKRRHRTRTRGVVGGLVAAAAALAAGGIAFILRKPRESDSDVPRSNGSSAAATPPMPARTAPR